MDNKMKRVGMLSPLLLALLASGTVNASTVTTRVVGGQTAATNAWP